MRYYKCCTPIGKCINHKCNAENLLDNVKNNVFQNGKQKEQATAELLNIKKVQKIFFDQQIQRKSNLNNGKLYELVQKVIIQLHLKTN